MHKGIKTVLTGAAAILLWNGLATFCKEQTDGFTVARLQSDIPYDQKWQLPSPSPQLQQKVDQILAQPFHYLNSGGQCFVFLSEDKHYVVKFFKNRFYKPYEWLARVPLPPGLDLLRKNKVHRILEKIDKDCTSYKIAYEDLPDETGLIYLHLHPQDNFTHTLAITDKLGIHHQLPLNKTAFLIQKYAEPISSYLTRVDQKEGERAVHTLVQAIITCAQKGIFDTDSGIHRNFGFFEGKPFFIDIGSFKKEPLKADPVLYKRELGILTARFREFLQDRYPHLVSTLDKELQEIQADSVL